MARMMAVAAVRVLELEGVRTAFGVPGVAINPFYAAMRPRNSIRRVLARHVEGASPMAEGYNSGYGEPGTREVNHPFLFDVLDQDGYPG